MTRVDCAKMYINLDACKDMKDSKTKPLILKKNLVKAIIYNKKILQSEYEILAEIGKPVVEKERDLSEKRNTILKKYCILDETGNILADNDIVRFDSSEKSILCLKEIEETLKTDIDEMNKLRLEYKESENEEVSIKLEDLIKITDDDIPEEANYDILEQLYKLV
jgi:transcription elongation factor